MERLESGQILTVRKFQSFFENVRASVIRSYLHSNEKIVEKSDGSYAGSLDEDLQKLWVKFLGKEFPEIVVLSEETEHEWPPKSDRFWIIDPLDGTHNKMWGLPAFGSMGAYVENGQVKMSALYLPAEHLLAGGGMYFAFRGCGSFKIQYGGIHQIHVSRATDTSNLLLLLEGPSKLLESNEFVQHARSLFKKKRTSASAVWAYALLACGGCDLPVGALVTFVNKPWDNLPGCLLVEEAGGRVTDHFGNPYFWGNCSNLIASNGYIHNLILSARNKP